MTLRHIFLASAAVFALNSCTSIPETRPITAQTLLLEPYDASGAQAFDVAAFFEAMPTWLETSFTAVDFNSVSGAMELQDLTLSIQNFPEYKLRIDQAKLWGGNPDALSTVMTGGATDAMASIFDRITLEGVHSDGLQWENGAQSASFTIEKLVLDGLDAKSFNLAPLQNQDNDTAGLINIIRTLAALSNSYALNGAVFTNLEMRLNESQGGAVLLSMDQGFTRGYDRGHTDYERIDGLKVSTRTLTPDLLTEVVERVEENLSQNPKAKILQPWMQDEMDNVLKNPIAFVAASAGARTVEREIETYEARNYDISGALRWLSKWRLPPITETDLIDLGEITLIGNKEAWNGQEIYSIARTDISALDFYWLIPSNYVQVDSGATISLLDAMDLTAGDLGLGTSADSGSQELLQLREAITALGMETIRADNITRWNWNGETGTLDTSGSIAILDLLSSDAGIQLSGPSLAEWNTLITNDASGEEIAKKISLGSLSYSLTDDQIMQRAFDYAASQMGEGATGEDLRLSIPTMVRLSGQQFAAMNPRIPGYLDAVANFISSGGTLQINANPSDTLSLGIIQEVSETAPQTLPDVLDLKVTHMPQ